MADTVAPEVALEAVGRTAPELFEKLGPSLLIGAGTLPVNKTEELDPTVEAFQPVIGGQTNGLEKKDESSVVVSFAQVVLLFCSAGVLFSVENVVGG